MIIYIRISFEVTNTSTTYGSDLCLVDSGASKHMTGFKNHLTHTTKEDSPYKVKLGDDYQYPIKGVGEASCKLH